MGARQSKRSVDITTATGASPESGGEVVAGKLGKLEDGAVAAEAAPKQNGDAVLKDKERQLESGTPENEKDSSTEKGLLVPPAASDSAITPAAVENGLGDVTPDSDMPLVDKSTLGEEPQSPTSPSEDTSEVASPTSPTSPTSGDEKQSEKKKEKKKKWSFRSISFSKKDKQKPSKKQQQQEENGDIEKVPEEGNDENAASAAQAGDAPSVSCNNEDKTEENTAQGDSIKSEATPKTSELLDKVSVKIETVEEKCEKPITAVSEVISENPTEVSETKIKDPTPTKVAACPETEDVPASTIAEDKVQESTQPKPTEEAPVAENLVKKAEAEILPPPPVEEQKEVCDHSSPPPLPISLPPSQVSVFAEKMLASDQAEATSEFSIQAQTQHNSSAQAETCCIPQSNILSDMSIDQADDLNSKDNNDINIKNLNKFKLEGSSHEISNTEFCNKLELISQIKQTAVVTPSNETPVAVPSELVPVIEQPSALQSEQTLTVTQEQGANQVQQELISTVALSEKASVQVQLEQITGLDQPEKPLGVSEQIPVVTQTQQSSVVVLPEHSPTINEPLEVLKQDTIVESELASETEQVSGVTHSEQTPIVAEPEKVVMATQSVQTSMDTLQQQTLVPHSEPVSEVLLLEQAAEVTQVEQLPAIHPEQLSRQSGALVDGVNRIEANTIIDKLESVDLIEPNKLNSDSSLSLETSKNIVEDASTKINEDLSSPPSSPASVQEAQPNSDSITIKTESVDNLPSPPPSPLSAQDTSVSESVAANTITEDPLPSPPQSPEVSSRDIPVTDSSLPAKTITTGSFDDLVPLPPPPTVANETVDHNGDLMSVSPLEISNGVPEKLPIQQEKLNEVAEVSATESTQNANDESITKEITEKVAGLVLLDDIPPVELPAESTVAIAEN